MFEGQSSHLPLKLNTSGVIPPIFASSLLLLPTTVANFNAGQGPEWLNSSRRSSATAGRCFSSLYVAPDHLLRVLLHGDRVQSDRDGGEPQEAWRLHSRASGPGERTAEYIDYVLSRITVIGAGYLAIVCLSAGNPDLLCCRAVLFRRHVAADRGQRHHGYGRADARLPAGPPIRRTDQAVQAAGKEKMRLILLGPPGAGKGLRRNGLSTNTGSSSFLPGTCCVPR